MKKKTFKANILPNTFHNFVKKKTKSFENITRKEQGVRNARNQQFILSLSRFTLSKHKPPLFWLH